MYGSIFFNGRALGRASISVACNGGGGNGSTLDDGTYRVNVRGEGRCTFTVTSGSFQGAARADVVSSPNSAQYNFVVVRSGNGFELRRQ